MRSTIATLLVLVAGAPLAGCFAPNATAMRTGPLYPPLPSNCSVRFENLSFQEANGKYVQLGTVTLSGTSSEPQAWEGETRDRLQLKVCEIGGTIVTPGGMAGGQSYMGAGTGMIQFDVWHERAALGDNP